jgi:hypothetical protein
MALTLLFGDHRDCLGADRGQHASVVLRRAEADHHHDVTRHEVKLLGHERCRWGIDADDHSVRVSGERAEQVPAEPQCLGALVEVPEEHPQINQRTHRVQLKLELGHDTEVAATTPQSPEQIVVSSAAARSRRPSAVTT